MVGQQDSLSVVHYWAGCPKSANSKWQRFLAVVQRCRREGWRNYLVWSRLPDDPALIEPFRDAGCEVIVQPRSRGNFDAGSIRRTFQLLRRLECDIFHCHNDHTSPLIGAALARVPVRIWSKLAMSSHYEQGISPQGIHRLQPSTRLSGMLAHKIIAASEAVRRELINLGFPSEKVRAVRCPVDLARCRGADGLRFRAELRIDAGDLLVIAVGHAVPVKGWDVLVRAFGDVANDFPQAHLALVGSSDSAEEREFAQTIGGLVEQTGLAGKVRLVGRRFDIPACLAGSDVFVLPSRSEGQPLALMEAMASGLPCIAASVGGIPETILHNVNGLLFERENVEQLADRLRAALSDGMVRRRLGEAAEQTTRAFGLETYFDAVFSLYCGLLERCRS
jgi:glycosyltransferase involved in cell wall biosynthesis